MSFDQTVSPEDMDARPPSPPTLGGHPSSHAEEKGTLMDLDATLRSRGGIKPKRNCEEIGFSSETMAGHLNCAANATAIAASDNMSRHISNVVDINPNKKEWMSLVQVLENGYTQKNPLGTNFKRLVLADSEGTKFTAHICCNNIRYFTKVLAQYKRYYISKAAVRKNQAKYHISSYPYIWYLDNNTLVEECVDSIPVPLGCQFEFTNFSDLHKYADTDSLHDVKAIVLKCFPPEQGSESSTKRDVVIVNEEKKLLLLTLWSPYDENEGTILADMIDSCPMIIATRLRVTTFNSLSLSTGYLSGFMINPPVTQDLQLQEWYHKNKVELQKMLQMEAYRKKELLLPFPKEEDIISIATAVESLKNKKACWIKGKISLPKQYKSSLWYAACANCQKTLMTNVTWIVTCPSCKQESKVQTMSKLTIQLDDGTASIHAILCSPHVEELIPFTSLQLKKAEESCIDLHDNIAMSIEKHTIVALIQTFEYQTRRKLTVIQAYKVKPEALPSTDVIGLF